MTCLPNYWYKVNKVQYRNLLIPKALQNLHLFPIKLLRRLDFPVPALPITRNLNKYSETIKHTQKVYDKLNTILEGKNMSMFCFLLQYIYRKIQTL